MSQPKKQHFVPQFLLKNFGHGKKNKAKIWTFDKATGRAYKASVRDTAHENRFYEGTNLEGHYLEAEKLCGFADHMGASALREVVTNNRVNLSGKQPVSLSYMVAMQMVRVPAERNSLEFMRESIVQKWGPDIRYENDERPISAYSSEDSKYSSILVLQSVPEFAKLLQTKICFLQLAPPSASFILSDNPVVRYNHLDYGPRGSLGIKQDGIDITLPITPKLALQYVCPKIAMMLSGSQEGQLIIKFQREGKAFPVKAESVTFVNSLQVIHSERYLYAANENDFALAIDMLREHPDLAIPASRKTIN